MSVRTSTWARPFVNEFAAGGALCRAIRYPAQADDGDPFGLQHGPVLKGFMNGYVYRVPGYMGEPVGG